MFKKGLREGMEDEDEAPKKDAAPKTDSAAHRDDHGVTH
jgi:hypothetical protein